MANSIYKSLVSPVLFKFDPEKIHHFSIGMAEPVLKLSFVSNFLESKLSVQSERLEKTVFGIKFPNPVGLAAGFDKDVKSPRLERAVGFGAVEFGTFTPRFQAGNPKPRIFRFSDSEALVNRMGFPSGGVLPAIERLRGIKEILSNGQVIGANIGKMKETPLEEAVGDYLKCFNAVKSVADYVTINVSSPNTPELRKLQGAKYLTSMLQELMNSNDVGIPILVKIAPDLDRDEVEEIASVLKDVEVAGVIATNTTVSKDSVPRARGIQGGLSGSPLFNRSLDVVKQFYSVLKGSVPIIGVGGISTGEHAVEMLKAGAELIQIYTGFVYEGPGVVGEINRYILKYLEENNLDSISEIKPTN